MMTIEDLKKRRERNLQTAERQLTEHVEAQNRLDKMIKACEGAPFKVGDRVYVECEIVEFDAEDILVGHPYTLRPRSVIPVARRRQHTDCFDVTIMAKAENLIAVPPAPEEVQEIG